MEMALRVDSRATCLMALALAACAPADVPTNNAELREPPMFSGKDMAAVAMTAESMSPAGSNVLHVCGGSVGISFFLAPERKGLVNDDSHDNAFAIVELPDGTYDMVFRNPQGAYFSSLKDGATIIPIYENDKGEIVLNFIFEVSGMVETIAIYRDGNSKIALWTSNKPRVAFNITKAGAFAAKCM